MEFQQSNTYQNLQRAYEDELIACAKYELFAKKARQEILLEIGYYFDTASRNEQFIAERLRSLLMNGTPDTTQNLVEAQNDELTESNLYRSYSRTATEEGYNDIASLFSGIANIKLNHNSSLQSFTSDIQNNELFCQTEEGLWICLGCGNILSGLCAPDRCPICGYPQGYYEHLRPL